MEGCIVKDCSITKVFARRMCAKHYKRWQRKLPIETTKQKQVYRKPRSETRPKLTPYVPQQRQCEFPGCSNTHKARGYCSAHYHQLWRGAELSPIVKRSSKYGSKCSEPDCTRQHYSSGFCRVHHQRMQSKV